MSILSVSLVCSYADTVITSGDHMKCFDNSSASSILSSNFNKSVRLSFDSLSDLCVQVNNDILSGVFGNSVKNYSATISTFTVGGSSYYGIALKYGSDTLWYCRYPYGLYYARIDTDTFIGYISDKLTTVVSNLGTISSTVSTISDTLSKWPSTLSTVSTISTNLYYFKTDVQNALVKLYSKVSGLSDAVTDIVDLLNTATYTCGYKSNASGTAYPTQTIPYDMAVQIAARINSEMLGKQMTVIKRDGSGTVLVTISRCLIDSNGYICVRSSSDNYYLCGKNNTIFVADQDYTKSIYSRLSDVISAVNNLTVGVDLSDVQLSVDASSINLFNNTAYCCGYRTDADGNLYPTLPIPFDSAAAILERLNTDYVDKKITVFSRSGAASSGYLRSASITSDGYIRIVLTNGYTYYLCDNTNVLYLVDASSNYGSRANDSLLNVSSKLDAILDQMQSTGGEYTCQHTYSQEMEQEPTCILPGLMVSTCSKCGNSYSEIVGALDHDWVCTEHVEAVTDPDTEEVTQAAYDVYTCSRCGQTYEDHTGDGAPTDYGETSIAKIIIKLFAKLGTFAGKIISWVVDLFTKTLGGINDLFTRFTELTAQITSFGGDYPAWLTGFWGVLSPDLQLALSFAFLCTFVGIIGKKLFFS